MSFNCSHLDAPEDCHDIGSEVIAEYPFLLRVHKVPSLAIFRFAVSPTTPPELWSLRHGHSLISPFLSLRFHQPQPSRKSSWPTRRQQWVWAFARYFYDFLRVLELIFVIPLVCGSWGCWTEFISAQLHCIHWWGGELLFSICYRESVVYRSAKKLCWSLAGHENASSSR